MVITTMEPFPGNTRDTTPVLPLTMFNRVFGRAPAPAPAPAAGPPPKSLSETIASTDARRTHLEAQVSPSWAKKAPLATSLFVSQVNECNRQLLLLNNELKKCRNPTQQTMIKQRMLPHLRRRKMLQQQAQTLLGVQMNMEATGFALESAELAAEQVATIKSQVGVLKEKTAVLDVDALEDAQDDLEDLMADVSEINEVMGRSFGLGADVDESDLDAELAALGDEMEGVDLSDLEGISAGPSAVPAGVPAVPAAPLPASAGTALPAVPAMPMDAYGGTV
jgi:charged multivesicular body protein 5